MRSDRHGDYEVASDGKSCWVNGPEVLVARFGGNAWELNTGMRWETHRFEGPRHVVDWVAFVRRVKDVLRIEVAAYHRPVGLDGARDN